jgi:hypothetical protein
MQQHEWGCPVYCVVGGCGVKRWEGRGEGWLGRNHILFVYPHTSLSRPPITLPPYISLSPPPSSNLYFPAFPLLTYYSPSTFIASLSPHLSCFLSLHRPIYCFLGLPSSLNPRESFYLHYPSLPKVFVLVTMLWARG